MSKPGVRPNGKRISSLRESAGWTQQTLASKVGCSKRTIENAERGTINISEENLNGIAEVLKVPVAEITVPPELIVAPQQPFKTSDNAQQLHAICGIWRATSTLEVGTDHLGRAVELGEFKYDVKLWGTGEAISGHCRCLEPGYEHAQFSLNGRINGGGFVTLDGRISTDAGAEDFFRAILHFHSTGVKRTMWGRHVLYWSEHRSIFSGRLEAHWIGPEND